MQKMHLNLGVMASAAIALLSTACQQEQQQRPAQQYATFTAQKQDRQVVDSYSASIRGRQDVSVMPQVGGTLTDIRVNEGDKVRIDTRTGEYMERV